MTESEAAAEHLCEEVHSTEKGLDAQSTTKGMPFISSFIAIQCEIMTIN